MKNKKKHRGCCFGCGILMLVSVCCTAVIPQITALRSKSVAKKLSALTFAASDEPEMDFFVEGNRFELRMPEQYGKMYYTESDETHYAEVGNGEAYVDNEILVTATKDASGEDIAAAAARIGAEIVGEITVTGTYQFRLQESHAYDNLNVLCQDLCTDAAVEDAYPDWLHFTISDSVSDYENGVGTFCYGDAVREDAKANDVDVYDDPIYDNRGISWDKEIINCYRAWKFVQSEGVTVSPVRVGLVDSYFINNDDLKFNKIFPSPSSGDPNVSHGMHVANIFAGNSQKGASGVYPYGSLGNPDYNLYGYARTLVGRPDPEKTSKDWYMYTSCVANMMSVATLVVQNVKVINISQGHGWGNNTDGLRTIQDRFKELGKDVPENQPDAVKAMYSDYSNFEPWVAEAQKVGAFYQRLLDAGYDFLIVNSAGNSGRFDSVSSDGMTELKYPRPSILPFESRFNSPLTMISESEYPAVYKRILVVGAVEPRPGTPESEGVVPMVAGYSDAGQRVDLFAPGGKLIESGKEDDKYLQAANGTMIYTSGIDNKYTFVAGTSFAAPEAAGAAALVWSVNSDLSGEQVKEILCNTAKHGCIYSNNEYGSDGGIGKISYAGNYRLLDVEKAVRHAAGTSAHGNSKNNNAGAIIGRVVWADSQENYGVEERCRSLEYATIVAVKQDGTNSVKKYVTQTGPNGVFYLSVPTGEYSLRYGKKIKNQYKGKEVYDLDKVESEKTVDAGTLFLSEKDDAVYKKDKYEIYTDHFDEFKHATGSKLRPKAWMRYNGHVYGLFDYPSSGNAKWWKVLFVQNPYPVAIETNDEQLALEALMEYGKKEAYLTGGQIVEIDKQDLYWAIEDGSTGYQHFANGHGFNQDIWIGNYASLYRGSGPDDPEYGFWKVHHETFATFFPMCYLEEYGYIMEWNTEP